MWVSVKNRTKLLETTTHEFRSPAVAIRNTADTLLKNWTNFEAERIQRKLNDILIDSSLLIRLTTNLDNLSGRPIGLKPREVLLFRDIVFKTVRQLRPLTEHLAFEHEGSHRLPPLWLVEEEVSQIFFNLIYNAIKYTDRQGVVRLKVIGGEDGPGYTLKIQDWGISVPEGFETKIFEREVQAPNALRSNVLGMGMGLAVSLDLARKMGGDLPADAAPESDRVHPVPEQEIHDLPGRGGTAIILLLDNESRRMDPFVETCELSGLEEPSYMQT